MKHTDEGCVRPLIVAISPVIVHTNGSYTLTAHTQGEAGREVPYDGLLDYEGRFCPNGGSTLCSFTSGAWGNYRVVNGSVVVHLSEIPDLKPGIYYAKFRPRGSTGSFPWSNEAIVEVVSSPLSVSVNSAVSVDSATVATTRSYTLYAFMTYKPGSSMVGYNGLLDYKNRFCPNEDPRSCTTSSGPWGEYFVDNGAVTVDLSKIQDIKPGVYHWKFRPRGNNIELSTTTEWSNEVAVTVVSPVHLCDYPHPPAWCRYIPGPNYDPVSQCGRVLKCDGECIPVQLPSCMCPTDPNEPRCMADLLPGSQPFCPCPTPPPTFVRVTSPNGGETFRYGSTQSISFEWTPDVRSLRILLVDDKGVETKIVDLPNVDENFGGSGPILRASYEWMVNPLEGVTFSSLPKTAEIKILGKYLNPLTKEASWAEDTSDDYFTIPRPSTPTPTPTLEPALCGSNCPPGRCKIVEGFGPLCVSLSGCGAGPLSCIDGNTMCVMNGGWSCNSPTIAIPPGATCVENCQDPTPSPRLCARDKMICPDGTILERGGPDCTFPSSCIPSASPIPMGYLDSADCNTIWGWAADMSAPSASVTVHIYDEAGNTLYAGSTTSPRQDVNDHFRSYGMTGTHGFGLTTPASVKDGRPHQISATGTDAAGIPFRLSGSPKTIVCPWVTW